MKTTPFFSLFFPAVAVLTFAATASADPSTEVPADAPAPFISEYQSTPASAEPSKAQKDASTVAKLLVADMPEMHILHKPFDATLSALTWTNYLNALDYEHIFFLKSDIEAFESAKTQLPQHMAQGNLAFAQAVFDRFRLRVQDRVAYVKSIVTNTFDYTTQVEFQLNRKNADWPESPEAMDTLWHNRILNSLIAYQVNAQMASEKNTEKMAQTRLEIAQFLQAPSTEAPTNPPSASALEAECVRFDQAIQALPALPTNSVQRLALRTTLTANLTPPLEGNLTNRIDSLLERYFAAQKGIKSPEKARLDAIERTTKNFTQYESILNDSDEEFYLSRFFNAMTSAYDPHSGYLSPIAEEDFGIDMQLSLQGIGATLQTDDGTAKIVEIIPGSPAERDTSPTRLVPGDKIIGVAQDQEDFVDIRHWPLYKAVRLIRGPKGSTVRLQVIPANDDNALKIVTLVRDEIKLEEQAATSAIETITDANGKSRKLGYIKLPTFYSSMKLGNDANATPRSATLDVARLISDLNAENIEGLVFDLRGNGGGSLPESVYLAGLFFKTGPVVQVRESRRTITLNDNDPGIAFSKPMVVLIDRISASASEIVAGALQDYGRAVIIGDSHTHGKGTVQTLRPMRNEKLGSLKATTASFYRITGSSTQIRGVSADICLPSIFEYYKELGEDKLPNALPWTRTGPARYRPVDDLKEIIPTLTERSQKRLASNKKWQKHTQFLEHFGVYATNQVVSLNYQIRLEKAKDEEKFTQALERQYPDELLKDDASEASEEDATPSHTASPTSKAEREKEMRKHDVVLNESYLILTDLIDLRGNPTNLNAELPPYDFFHSFFQ